MTATIPLLPITSPSFSSLATSPTEDDYLDFIDACRYGELETVTQIYSKFPSSLFNIHFTSDDNKITPLHMAAANNHLDIARFLISKGAEINRQNSEGNTSLHWAALHGHIDIIRLFLEYHPDLFITNSFGRTCIMEAMIHLHEDTVAILLLASAKSTATTNSNTTEDDDDIDDMQTATHEVLSEEDMNELEVNSHQENGHHLV